MIVEFEWASYQRLVEHSFFEDSMRLYALEKELQTPIPDSLHWTRRFEYPWILSKLQPSERVLDVGAGATALQFLISRMGSFVTSADVDQGAVEWINGRTSEQLVKNPKGVIGGLPNLPFLSGSFETVMCVSVLEHLPKDVVLGSVHELVRVSSRDVLVTMDVSLGENERQVDERDFSLIAKDLGFDCPGLGRQAIVFGMDGREFAVACMRLRR